MLQSPNRIFTLTLAMSLALLSNTVQAEQALQVKVYNAQAQSFHVNSVLITGASEALVIDSGFTRADALRIAANVLDSGKQLKTIFVSQADPDYYFGVEVLTQQFPQAQVLARPEVLAKIKAKLDGKVAFWGPKLGANAPQKPILPQAWQGDSLTVDGEKVEIRSSHLAHRPYVWIPSIKTIAGNIAVFGGLHVWTADTQTPAERSAWIAQLDEMAALAPTMVIPGHMQAGTALDASSIAYTKAYLQNFEKFSVQAKTAAELIEKLKQAYPTAGLGIALEIGAKVNKGEMKW